MRPGARLFGLARDGRRLWHRVRAEARATPARLRAWRDDLRHRSLPPERRPWTGGRVFVLVVFALMFVAGTVLFTQMQSQQIFKDASYELLQGLAQRNDGGILFGAGVMALTFTLLLGLFVSPRATKRPLKMATVWVGLTALLVMHLSIFVNGFILPGSGEALFTASFLYHDSPSLNLAALFVITLVTLVIGGLVLVSTYALLYPRGYQRHLSPASNPGAARGVAHVSWLATVVPLLFYVAVFFHAGLTADEAGEQRFLATNVILLFYLASATLLLLAVLLSIRSSIALWHGRAAATSDARRAHRTFAVLENWTLGPILFLLAVISLIPRDLLILPIQGNRVFATNARGTATFITLLLIPYLFNRRATRRLLSSVAPHRPAPSSLHRERSLTVAQGATYLILLPALMIAGDAPITLAATVLAISGGLFLLFALRLGFRDNLPQVRLRDDSVLPHFAAAVLLLATSGLMLWGTGNTIEAVYAQEGGFIRQTATERASFSTLFQFAGAALLALPPTIALALKVQGGPAKYGPLLLLPFTAIVGMILYFSISTESVWDATLGATDVRVGFAQIGLTVTDTVALTLFWSVLAAGMLLSLAWLLQRTWDLAPRGVVPPKTTYQVVQG